MDELEEHHRRLVAESLRPVRRYKYPPRKPEAELISTPDLRVCEWCDREWRPTNDKQRFCSMWCSESSRRRA